MRVARNVPNRTACTQLGIPRAEHDSSDMRLQARAGAHRARLQGNNQRAIGKIPRTKRPSGLRHGLDLGVRQRIGVRLAHITATADHRSPSVKHDGTDRYLAFRGGLAGQFNRQLHVVTAYPTLYGSARVKRKTKHAHKYLLVGWKRLKKTRKKEARWRHSS